MLLSSGATAAIATPTPDGAMATDVSPSAADPWESTNRSLFSFGMKLDHAFARPLAHAYMQLTGPHLGGAIHNVLQNLQEPIVFANDVLQVRPRRAARTAGRFVTNSTLGVGGVFDMATRAGLPDQDNDFGLTLGHYGVGSGPYVFVPLLGPSNVRDLTGRVVDVVADPFNWARFHHYRAVGLARTVLTALDARAQADSLLNTLDTTAADPYATVRSVYIQKRQAEVSGGETDLQSLPDIPADPAPATATPGQ